MGLGDETKSYMGLLITNEHSIKHYSIMHGKLDCNSHTHARTHTRTHARTHTRTYAHRLHSEVHSVDIIISKI